MITGIEEISMNFWPAFQTVLLDGWVLRFAEGATKRSNSVNPVYPSSFDTQEKIEICEKMYSERNLKTVFKMTEKVHPPDLDHMLEARGYEKNTVTSVQTLPVAAFEAEPCGIRYISEKLNPEMADCFVCFGGIEPSLRQAYKKILESIIFKRCFLTINMKDEPVCCGLGVLEDEYLGIFDVAASPDYRGWGFGRLAMEGILEWGRENGAETAFLQVIADNTPAIKLYQRMGFTEIYKYWYRIKDNRA
jgi:GNAT superfamily N-acetyltransferase